MYIISSYVQALVFIQRFLSLGYCLHHTVLVCSLIIFNSYSLCPIIAYIDYKSGKLCFSVWSF